MSDKIKYLYENKEISNILAEGFAKICQQKPKFPINYLARYLKNHTAKNNQKTALIDRLQTNQKTNQKLLQQQANLQQELLNKLQKQKTKAMQKDQFLTKISTASRHEQTLDFFCQWINEKLQLSGIYIGELEHQAKKINLNQEDGEQAHLELEKQKIIKFKFASQEQQRVVVGKILPQESVVGKILNEPQTDEPPAEQQGGQNQQTKIPQIKGQVYIPTVVGNQELKFFRFPKLGAYFSSVLTIKSYLKEKLFDENTVKVENYRKVLHDFEKEMQEKQTKFKQAYDEKVNSGAQQKQLEDMEKEFERQKSEIKKPQQQDFSFSQRKFVICADTLGLDRQISQKEKQQIRQFILHLKQSWQAQEKSQLEKDIELYLSLSKPAHDEGQQAQGQNFQQQWTNLIEEEEKEIPSHEEVEKVKDNEKLLELESNTVRLQKTKEYMTEEKNLKFWDHLLELNIVKYHQVIKQMLILFEYKKDDFCFPGTNALDWQKTKNLLKTNQPKIFERINTLNARGSRPEIILPYAKCQRISKNIQGLQPQMIVNYNFYLALILRLVQLYTKVRVQDKQARVAKIQVERENREQKLKEAEEKATEKKEKLDSLKAELEEKGQLQAFDEQAWKTQYDEENPPVQVPDEIPNDIDRDLEDVPENQENEQKSNE